MARKVTCVITKEKGTTDTFFKAENGKWYKSREIYEQSKYENKCREEIITRLCDYCGFKQGEPVPTLLFRRLKELNFYSNEVILNTIKEQNSSILWAINNKSFSNTVGKIQYIFAIISNNISDVNRKIEKQKKEAERKKPKEIMVEEIEISSNPTTRNLSSWLDDD